MDWDIIVDARGVTMLYCFKLQRNLIYYVQKVTCEWLLCEETGKDKEGSGEDSIESCGRTKTTPHRNIWTDL